MIYYHGTTNIFNIGDKILKPSIDTGILREDWRKKNLDKVYFTTSLLSAERFAYKASQKYGGCGIVYIVKPIGDVVNLNTNEYIADKAIILDVCEIYDKGVKKWITK